MKVVYKSPRVFVDSHKVGTLLMACSDFRFRKAFNSFARKKGVKEFDRIIAPGGHLLFFSKEAGGPDTKKAALNWVKLLTDKHHIKEVCVVGHEGCAAYANSPKYLKMSPADLDKLHLKDLKKAGGLLKKYLPNISIRLFFASPQRDKTVIFKHIA